MSTNGDDTKTSNVTKSCIILVIVLLFVLMAVLGNSKELPEIVQIKNLDEKFDDHRVAISGWVREAKVFNGKMGSHSIRLTLGDDKKEIYVYTSWNSLLSLNHHVVVIGKFNSSGRYAGYWEDNYIVAEDVIDE